LPLNDQLIKTVALNMIYNRTSVKLIFLTYLSFGKRWRWRTGNAL